MKRFILYLLIIVLISSCFSYPYVYHMDNIESIIVKRKIAIMPCNFIFENNYSKDLRIKNIIEDSLRIRLKQNGFEIINSNYLYKDIDSIKFKYDGFYNVKTGELDTSKVSGFRRDLIHCVCEKYKVTSILFPDLVVRKALIQNGGYCWDGRFYYSFGLSNTYGQTIALSLYVRIYDIDGNVVFDNAGGIQPLSKVRTPGFQDTKDNEILKKPKDLSKALHIIFEPLNVKLNNKNAL